MTKPTNIERQRELVRASEYAHGSAIAMHKKVATKESQIVRQTMDG